MVRIQANHRPQRTQLNSSVSSSLNNNYGFITAFKAGLMVKTYPIGHTHANFFWVLIYSILLNAVAFGLSAPIILIYSTPADFSLSIFTTLLTLAYIVLAGVIYKKYLGSPPNNMKVGYVQMMYLCMFSFVYLPLCVPLALLIDILGWIFYFVVVMISQYFLSTNIYNVWEFTDSRTAFFFNILNFVLQFGFLLSYMAIMYTIRAFK